MSELKVAVMTGAGQYMTAAGCMNPGVRQTGFIETTTMLRLQRVGTTYDGENGAGGEEEFLIQAPITNQTQALQPFWDSACHCQQAHLFHSLFHTQAITQTCPV